MIDVGNSGRMSVLQFGLVGFVLVMLLVGGVYFGVRQLEDTALRPSSRTAQQTSETKKDAEQKEKEAAQKQQEAADKKAAEEKKQAEAQAAQAAEEKKKQEQAAAQAAQQQSQQNAATTSPETVASTGPEDTLFAIIGVAALAYASYGFLRSRKSLQLK